MNHLVSCHKHRVRLLCTVFVALTALVGAALMIFDRSIAVGNTHRPNPALAASLASKSGAVRPQQLAVLATVPVDGATAVDGSQPIVVTTSAPVDLNGPRPTISPAVPGHWTATGHDLKFTPAGAFPPSTAVTVTMPTTLRAGSGAHLAVGRTISFHTNRGSTLRLQQLLASLGYLPLQWNGAPAPNLEASQRAVFDPPPGGFTWTWPNVPGTLAATWTPGAETVMTSSAVMAFEYDHHLAVDGVAGSAVWSALLAPTPPAPNPNGYTYAVASKALPETLTVWHDGIVVAESPANTGISQAPTADGTFPVYERLATQTMRGTNPNGSAYADPVAWVAYFNGGDAIHYIARSSYGSPQSLGCVEIPYQTGQTIWPHLTLGTLVTVTG